MVLPKTFTPSPVLLRYAVSFLFILYLCYIIGTGSCFLPLLLFNWNLVWIPVVSTIQPNQSLVLILFSKNAFFSRSHTNATLYPVCLQDLHQAVEPVQGGRYMLIVKTPKLHTLKLKLSLTSISTIFLVCSLSLNSTLHSSCFTQTSKSSSVDPTSCKPFFLKYLRRLELSWNVNLGRVFVENELKYSHV